MIMHPGVSGKPGFPSCSPPLAPSPSEKIRIRSIIARLRRRRRSLSQHLAALHRAEDALVDLHPKTFSITQDARAQLLRAINDLDEILRKLMSFA